MANLNADDITDDPRVAFIRDYLTTNGGYTNGFLGKALSAYDANRQRAGEVWRCEDCGDMADPLSSEWRWTGECWQHHHGLAGHINAKRFGEDPAHRQRAGEGFDGWWEDQIRRNGDCDMGADYRHWAHAGWNAALSAAEAER